jgi:prepilin-type N-terminal cleavage/methylation domain-containing protein
VKLRTRNAGETQRWNGPAEPTARRVAGRARCGFTLIELMVVVTVLGILTGVSAPYMLREKPSVQAGKSAETLAQALRLARFRAISMNRDVYVRFQPSGIANFYTAYVNLGDPAVAPSGTAAEIGATTIEFTDYSGTTRGTALLSGVTFGVGSATQAPDGGSVTALDLPANPIVFDARGAVKWPTGVTKNFATVYVQATADPASVRAVQLSRVGLVKVWRLQGGTWQ